MTEQDQAPAAEKRQHLTPGEAARELGTSKTLLTSWRETGTGPPWAEHAPRLVRYPWEPLKAWQAANAEKLQPAAPGYMTFQCAIVDTFRDRFPFLDHDQVDDAAHAALDYVLHEFGPGAALPERGRLDF